jgi:hypothetical protein
METGFDTETRFLTVNGNPAKKRNQTVGFRTDKNPLSLQREKGKEIILRCCR